MGILAFRLLFRKIVLGQGELTCLDEEDIGRMRKGWTCVGKRNQSDWSEGIWGIKSQEENPGKCVRFKRGFFSTTVSYTLALWRRFPIPFILFDNRRICLRASRHQLVSRKSLRAPRPLGPELDKLARTCCMVLTLDGICHAQPNAIHCISILQHL